MIGDLFYQLSKRFSCHCELEHHLSTCSEHDERVGPWELPPREAWGMGLEI